MTRSHRAALVVMAVLVMVIAPIATLFQSVRAADTVRDGAVLYAEPNWDSPVLGAVSSSQAVTLTGAPVDSFYPVTVDGQAGWVNGTNLQIDKGASQAAAPAPADQSVTPGPVSADSVAAPADDTAGAATGNPDGRPHAFEEPTATPDPSTAEAPPGANIEPGPGSAPPISTDETGAPLIAAPPAASLAPVGDGGSSAGAEPAPDNAATQPNSEPAPSNAPDAPAATNGDAQPPAASNPVGNAPSGAADADPEVNGNAPSADQPALPAEIPPSPPPADPTPTPVPVASPSDPATGNAPLVAPVTDETESNVSEAEPEASPAPSPTPEPTPQPTPAPELQPWGPATAKWDSPLRDWASDDAGLVFMVPAGSTVEQLGEKQGRWVKVNYMWMFGWMDFGSLEPPAPVTEEEIPDHVEAEEVKTPKAGAGEAWTTVDLSLRAGPSANEAVLDSVPAGTKIELTGVMENGFQRVAFRGTIGWISNEYLSLPSDPKPGQTSGNAKKNYSEQQILGYIADAAKKYGQSKGDMERVARCESNLDPNAVNPSGSYGLFQFIRSTWESTPYGNKDIFDPKWNALAAGWMWEQGRKSEWVCQ